MSLTDRSNPEARRQKQSQTWVGVMVAIIALVALVDQLVKTWMLSALRDGNIIYLVGDWFRLRLLFNSGAAFSIGENATWVFTCIQLIFVIGIVATMRKIKDPWQAVGLALIAGGALGNLIDRLFRAPAFFIGHVVDFISVGNFAVFNVADSAISCGVVLVAIAMLLEGRKEGKE
ncbi:signal peptidase II [Corynebacterium diphtheriae]|uniref:signal peptidase II n=2 Tax=Corynebacterium diphtheriae TaxID=1717 RepID=UPI0009B5E096|nr:signal peptidase II [Corynebacterium diphtheriae]